MSPVSVKRYHLLATPDPSKLEKSAGKAAFTLAEVFGSVTNLGRATSASKLKLNKSYRKLTLKELSILLKKEYENLFWATGNMDVSLYATDCLFADPFSSFGGPGARDRFKQNADNFSKFILDPKPKVGNIIIDEKDYIISVEWSFVSALKLPWRPILAASGMTIHTINRETGLIEKYQEQWKSKPLDVVLRLFKPGTMV